MQFENESEGLQAKAALNEATIIYQQMLFDNPIGEQALDYLVNERWFSRETLKRFKIGFAPDGWDFYHRFIEGLHETNGASFSALEKAGLIRKGKEATPDNPKYYAPFRNRIMFPLMQREQVIGFAARKLEDGNSKNPKYLNTGETPLYNKGRFLYNGDAALTSARQEGFLFVVEGPTSVLQASQQNLDNMTASCGTAFTKDHLTFINKRAPGLEIILCFDSDEAGLRAAERNCEEFLGYPINVCLLPRGDDPDSFMRDKGSLLDYAKACKQGAFDFLIDRKSSGLDLLSPEGAVTLLIRFKPLISAIPPGNRKIYLESLKLKTGLSPESMSEAISPNPHSNGGQICQNNLADSLVQQYSQISYVSPPRAWWEIRFMQEFLLLSSNQEVITYFQDTLKLEPDSFKLLEARLAYEHILNQSRENRSHLNFAGTEMFGQKSLLEYASSQHITLDPKIVRRLFERSSRNGFNNVNGTMKNPSLESIEEALIMVRANALPEEIREQYKRGVSFSDLHDYLNNIPGSNE